MNDNDFHDLDIGYEVDKRYRVLQFENTQDISRFYSVTDIADSTEYTLNYLNINMASINLADKIRFNNDMEELTGIHNDTLVNLMAVCKLEENPCLIFEKISLDTMASNFSIFYKLDLNKKIKLFLQIIEAIKILHDKNLLHLDINPRNIYYNLNNDKLNVKIGGTGLSHLKDLNSVQGEENIQNTFCYISPEKSGVLKRKIDERSDLYSLGVLFYFLVTGVPPFTGHDVSSILHQHIAIKPEVPSDLNREVPLIIGNIILKLLEKDPDLRYQSCTGLISDLNKFLKGEFDFNLGEDDVFTKLTYKTNLVGRDEELDKIKRMFEGSIAGNGGLVFVGGEAGRGKTRLVEELKGYVYENKKCFINGKSFSGENKHPYSTFKDALDVYLKIFNRYSDERKKTIKDYIKSELGDMAGLVVTLHPGMSAIVENYQSLIKLDSEQENKRFFKIIASFFCHLAKIEEGLTILLDDVQWLDEGSFFILENMLENIATYPLLIIGTFRDNEITEDHPFKKIIKIAEIQNYNVQVILLQLFDLQRMNVFIAHLLHDSEKNCLKITEFILDKTKGNPFFAIELLKQLVEEGAVFRNKNQWSINDEILSSIEVSSSMIDIILRRINSFTAEEQELLSLCAIIGSTFTMDLLFELADISKKKIVEIVDKAIALQFLELDVNDKGTILFLHDRIKEAFYKNTGDEQRKNNHLKIAAVLENKYINGNEKVVFDLAHHYIESGVSEKTLEYAYPAAFQAQKTYASEDAIKYFKIAINELEKNNWIGNEIWFECMQGLSDVLMLTCKNNEAIKICESLIPYCRDKNQEADTYSRISRIYYQMGDWKTTEEYVKRTLGLYHEYVPTSMMAVYLFIVKNLIVEIFTNHSHASFFVEKKNRKKDQYRKIINAYYPILWTYGLENVIRWLQIQLRMFIIPKRKLGFSDALQMATTSRIWLFGSLGFFSKAEKYIKLSLELSEKLDNLWLKAQTMQAQGYYHEFKGEWGACEKFNRESLALFNQIGESKSLSMSYNGIIHCYLYTSDYPKMKAMVDMFYDIVRKANDDYLLSAAYLYYGQYYHEIGDYDNMLEYSMKSYNLSSNKSKRIWLNYCTSGIEVGMAYIRLGNYKLAIEYLERSRKIHETKQVVMQYANVLYPRLAEAYLLDFNSKRSSNYFRRVIATRKIKKLAKTALKKTSKWAVHYGTSLRIYGSYLVLINKYKKAIRYYERSIDHCKKYDRKYELALSLYEYGKLLKKIDNAKESQLKLNSALRIFTEIGSKFYIKEISSLLGVQEESNAGQRLMDKQRLASILRVSQDISSILNLDELLKQVMRKAIEVTGAQRGYLFIVNKDNKLDLRTSLSIINAGLNEYSQQILDDVIQTKQPILIANAELDDKYKKYYSVLKFHLKSILALPIMHHDKLIGICYVDNPLSADVFSEDDVEILNILMTQSAISIENASLYANLEEKVKERTAQLQATLEDVKKLKEQQDGDYFLTSLLIEPLCRNTVDSAGISVDYYIEQKKKFTFRNRSREIGGDLCVSHNIILGNRKYVVFINADAMGKSMQGAGGAIVLGTAFGSLVDDGSRLDVEPEKWLSNITLELQRVFESFSGSMMLSMFIGLIDEATGVLYYINAEHPFPVLYRNKKASFVSSFMQLRKLGWLEMNKEVVVKTFLLEKGDIIIAGSDGRDDLVLGTTNTGSRIINEDETEILRRVEDGAGNLKEISKQIKKHGELSDDLSLLRIEYDKDPTYSRVNDILDEVIGCKLQLVGLDENFVKSVVADKTLQNATKKLMAIIKNEGNCANYKNVLTILDRIYEWNPVDHDVIYAISYYCKLQKNYIRAIRFGEKLELLDPLNVRNLINLANLYVITNDIAKGHSVIGRIREIDPSNKNLEKLEAVSKT